MFPDSAFSMSILVGCDGVYGILASLPLLSRLEALLFITC